MMDVPLLDCPQQDKRMSDYTFETGKMAPDEYEAIHNGPDLTEVTILFVSPSFHPPLPIFLPNMLECCLEDSIQL